MQGVAVGIDVAKEFHWVRAVDRGDSRVLLDRRVDNDPPALAQLVGDLQALREHGPLSVGIDVVGGIASLLTAMLLEGGLPVVHVSGLAVNRARQGTTGGEHKSDPRDAAVIADQVRHRRDLRGIDASSELDAEIRLLVEFPRFRGHLTAEPSGRPGRMSVDAYTAAVFVGVPS
jgi:hypothetical protein